MHQSNTRTSLSLFRRISFAGSVFPGQSYQTTSLFDSRVYRNFYHELKIKNLYSTPWYPQSNGQAEASNKMLLTALKKWLDTTKGKWVDEFPGVLWAYRTAACRPIGISPFALTYGMEAIIPTEIGMPALRMDMPEQLSTESIIKDLDTADELRETAIVRVASYHC